MDKNLSPKSFTVAMVLLLTLSLTFLGGLYYFLNNGRLPWEKISPLLSYIPVTREPVSFGLELSEPDDNILTAEKSIIVAGKTSPGAIVLINNGEINTGFEVSQTGDFSKVINLTDGLNTITIAAFDNLGDQKSEVRTVYSSEEKLQ